MRERERAAGRARTTRQVLFVSALAVVTGAFVAFTSARHGFFDLRVYHGAVNYWVHDGGEIYDFLAPNSRYGFTYPPFAAFAMLPMAYVGLHAAIVVSVAAAVVTTGLVLWWLVDPIARREGWTRWFAFAVALCLVAAFEPLRETVNFGQVNTLLLFLVAADLLWLVARGSRYAGVGVGLATAVKLTPGIFIVYLIVTGRWRAAAVASGTATAATLAAAALAPDASREFWTHAIWDTDRVGSLSYVSNQSLRGVVARLDPEHPSTVAWLVLVAAVLVVWVWRSRAAVRAGYEAAGLALTGVVGCLVSPVTWVHHLVWLLPALVLLVDGGLAAPAGSRRRRALLFVAGSAYALLISRLVWVWQEGTAGVLGMIGSSAYVWASIALLVAVPVRSPVTGQGRPAGVPDLDQLDAPPGLDVVRQHP
ncbi:MAG TPA: glycosyltransferase 87 family protein [Pilimelia sp.]|nr:glycosyltransferase 87 family protein [Pilimelia sp.]